MKINNAFLLLTVLLINTGCYGPLKGRVVDAETGEPIEGAVAMAEWTRTKGLGNTYTVSVKVVEAVSDKDGNIELDGCFSPFVNEPTLTIYKKGYVAWNNGLIFPDLNVRDGFEWKIGQVFQLEKFRSTYSHDAHVSFISSSINSTIGNKNRFISLFEWEEGMAYKERRRSN